MHQHILKCSMLIDEKISYDVKYPASRKLVFYFGDAWKNETMRRIEKDFFLSKRRADDTLFSRIKNRWQQYFRW